MTTELAPRVQQRLSHALAQFHHWQCEPALTAAPVAVAQLGAGHSNHSVLVGRERQFVVRLDGIDLRLHGVNRHVEWATLAAAHRAGIAPAPRYLNVELGCLVCDYLPPDLPAPVQQAADIAALLRAIHTLPARHYRLDLGDRLRRYENQLQHRGHPLLAALAGSGPALTALLRRLQSTDTSAPVLCHHDLLRANRLASGGRLWAIDWEYCAMGSRWYDLAVVLAGDELDSAAGAALVQAYLGRAPAPAEQALIAGYGCIYRYLELLWYAALEQPVLAAPVFDARLQRLRAALAALAD